MFDTMFSLIIGAFIVRCAVCSSNPCVDSPKLHDLERRYISYQVDIDNSEKYVCDAFVIPSKGKWYRTDGINMPTKAPWSPGCGTLYPIWLRDPLPGIELENIVVNRTACVIGIFSSCDVERQIKIKRCSDGTFVYFLRPTSTCDNSYCFGCGTQDTAPTYDPGEPTVNHTFTHHKINGSDNPTQIRQFELHQFRCIFISSEMFDFFYQVTWYINDKTFMSKTVKRMQLDDIILHEDNMTNIGVFIKCSVRPKNSKDGTPGIFRVSRNDFYGIQLLTTDIDLPRDGDAIIYASMSMPFGCLLINGQKTGCILTIAMTHPGHDGGCDVSGNGAIVGQKLNCRTEIDIQNWNMTHELKVHWKDGYNYRLDHTEFLIDFRVFRYPEVNVWNNHSRFKPVKIKLYERNLNPKTKQCRIINDPHIYNFDTRKIEHHITGVFVLYRDLKNTVYEVQHQSARCNGPYHCTCGVAIRSGADVFKIDYCDNRQMIEYVTCHEKKLEVRRISDTRYLTTLPTGTSIQVNIERIYHKYFLSVYINPSIYDWNNTRGLCGTISGKCPDDFVDPNGVATGDHGSNSPCNSHRFTPTNFINAWRVSDVDNLFKLLPNSVIKPSFTTSAYCKCPYEDDSNIAAADFDCTASSTFDCAIKNETDKVGAQHCNKIFDKRRKRSLEYPFQTAEKKKRKKRTIGDEQREVNMTPQEADEFCLSVMAASPVFDACQDIPEVNAEDYLEICALDIVVTHYVSKK